MTDDLIGWIALSNLPGVGPVTFRNLRDRFGNPENVFHAPPAEVARMPGLPDELLEALRRPESYRNAARDTAAALDRDGVNILTSDDPRYPAALRDLNDLPPVLYVRGELPSSGDRAFSVAGSTHPSAQGADIARRAGAALAEAGCVVVSGYAPGIDTAAHLGALEAGGRTVLFLPTGLRAFELRAEFAPFEGEVGGRIALVSERPPDDTWSARNAVARDRLIAALGRALLVVEARPRSGTMITFHHARRLGRPAYVVRHRRPPPGAEGNREAIRTGGIPVDSLRAVREVARSRELPAAAPASRQGELF